MTTSTQNTLLIALTGNFSVQNSPMLDLDKCMDGVLEQISQAASACNAVSHAVTGIGSEIDASWHEALYRSGQTWQTTVIASGNRDMCNSASKTAVLKAGATFLEFPEEENTHQRDEAVATYSDMLVVVWDGDNAGDTARLIRHFLLLRKPVVWLEPISGKTSVRCCQLEHLDHSALTSLEWGELSIKHLFDEDKSGLAEMLPKWLRLLAFDRPPVTFAPDSSTGFIESRYGWWDKFFRSLFEPKSRRTLAKLLTVKPIIEPFRGKAFERNPDPGDLSAAFDKADIAAGQCAGKYRSTSVLAYLLSAGAIISAICGILTHAAVWA